VQQVQVEVVGAQPGQAAPAGLGGAPPRGVVGQHLADEEDVVPPAPDRPPDERLGCAVAVHLGGIDQRQPDLDAGAKGGEVDVVPVRVLAQVPGAHPENRDRRSVGQGHGADGGGRHGLGSSRKWGQGR
jgi:hypothetical protein